MRLYSYRWSMGAYRVKVALALKGVAVEEVLLDLDAGEQNAAAFRAVTPEAVVPALVLPDGRVLTQSTAILEYLDERFRDPPLLPAGAEDRARVRSIASIVVADTHPLITHRVADAARELGGMTDDAVLQWRLRWIRRGLDAIEARLAADSATGRFCHGDQVTMADICLASLVLPAEAWGVSAEGFPTVSRVLDACRDIAAFAKASPS